MSSSLNLFYFLSHTQTSHTESQLTQRISCRILHRQMLISLKFLAVCFLFSQNYLKLVHLFFTVCQKEPVKRYKLRSAHFFYFELLQLHQTHTHLYTYQPQKQQDIFRKSLLSTGSRPSPYLFSIHR